MKSTNAHQKFTELHVWQQARELKNSVYELVKLFPREEKFSLADQTIRSVRSVCANIAEGHGRYTYKDQLHFCIQARGSLSETLNHLIDALDCEYIDLEKFNTMEKHMESVAKLLNGYITFLRNDGNQNKTGNNQ